MAKRGEWIFCPMCGGRLDVAERYGKPREGCPECGWVRFLDPKVAVSTYIESDEGILMIQRKNPPFMDLWTLPAGFMDRDEDPRGAAERECFEETGLIAKVTDVREIYFGKDHANGSDLVIFFNAKIIGGKAKAADDAKALGWFPKDDLPELAFNSTKYLFGDGKGWHNDG